MAKLAYEGKNCDRGEEVLNVAGYFRPSSLLPAH